MDDGLAKKVATGLGLIELPEPATPAAEPRSDLATSDALSILKNGPKSFKGRKFGVLVADGADPKVLAALRKAADVEGATVEVIAQSVAGAIDSGGQRIPAEHQLAGAPSVLFDAIAVLGNKEGFAALAKLPPARDFVADAYAHYKFVGFTQTATSLFEKAGLPTELDEGFVEFVGSRASADFIKKCRALRFWDRSDGA